MPRVEQSLISYIWEESQEGDVLVTKGVRNISGYTGIALSLNLSVQQVKGALANLRQKKYVDMYVRSDGTRQYWLTGKGMELVENMQEQRARRDERRRTASFAN